MSNETKQNSDIAGLIDIVATLKDENDQINEDRQKLSEKVDEIGKQIEAIKEQTAKLSEVLSIIIWPTDTNEVTHENISH